MTSVDASTRGRRNRAKGAEAERKLAVWLRPWWPAACRAVRNTHPDPGDLDCTSPGLYWSVKNVADERIDAWMGEMNRKCGMSLGLLVVRRSGHASPGEWWCWMHADDFLELCAGMNGREVNPTFPVRTELRHVMPLLVEANYARTPKEAA